MYLGSVTGRRAPSPPNVIDIIMTNETFKKEFIEEMATILESRFESIDQKFESTEQQIQDLILITKMGFGDTNKRIDRNTQGISELSHRAIENADRVPRVEITMNQEFAAATRQRRRILERVDNHEDRLCTLESC